MSIPAIALGVGVGIVFVAAVTFIRALGYIIERVGGQ